jgi:Lrp/AsnC family leucine-responsive transcriptional regulator
MSELDDFDRRILDALRADARASNVEMAERVGLSHSAVSRRVRRLEEEGVIRGYRAVIDPIAAGQGARAFVSVRRLPEATAADLARALAEVEEVVGVWILSGEFDVMVEIVASDMQAYAKAMLERVQTIHGVASTRSMFVLKAVSER